MKDTILRHTSEFINKATYNKEKTGSDIILVNSWRNEFFLLNLFKLLKVEGIFAKPRNNITCKVSSYIVSGITFNTIRLKNLENKQKNTQKNIHEIIATGSSIWLSLFKNCWMNLPNVSGNMITGWLIMVRNCSINKVTLC